MMRLRDFADASLRVSGNPSCLAPDEQGRPFRKSPSDLSQFAKNKKKLKVMVVDDEPLIAKTLVDILEGEGCEAVAVFSGESAIDQARLTEPDVVLSDVAMPGVSGIQAAERIQEFLPDCRIILFSGQASTKDVVEEVRSTGKQFELLSKPIAPNVLLAILGLPGLH